ncbi:unnamed protein product [Ceratitis capitata]|uniref:(Mediterranean fruit fly) hypothetical protein n=1 Tax=Ceratitis capitata TaxID=7213 RepID=A0A811U3T5_CERCA|nr:unnamed protein product [Ceratitis capitata]
MLPVTALILITHASNFKHLCAAFKRSTSGLRNKQQRSFRFEIRYSMCVYVSVIKAPYSLLIDSPYYHQICIPSCAKGSCRASLTLAANVATDVNAMPATMGFVAPVADKLGAHP